MLPVLAALAAALAPPPTVDTEPTERECSYITREGESVFAPGLQVLAWTRGEGPYTARLPEGAAVRCERSVIVPAANDWKVLAAGHSLYIVEATADAQPRAAVLELAEGRVRYRFVRGRMTEEEATRIDARVNAFQPHLNR